MTTDLIGRKPNQAPANNDLGEMAYQNRAIDIDNFRLGGIDGLRLLIKSWNPTYWFDYDDELTRNGIYIYSKGSSSNLLTSQNVSLLTLNGRKFWISNGNSNARFYGSGLRKNWGYQTSYFLASAYTPNHLKNGSSGSYWLDANSGSRVSVSADSFGSGIDHGEISHHAGSSSGNNDGNNFVDYRMGSEAHGDFTIHAVAGSMQNWSDPLGGEQVRFCTLNRGTLGENLFNNGTASGTGTSNEIYWGNRHSNDRGTTSRAYSEMILFCEQQLNQEQYLILEHYFKLKYGGPNGRAR